MGLNYDFLKKCISKSEKTKSPQNSNYLQEIKLKVHENTGEL
jgi:hypothetical protein